MTTDTTAHRLELLAELWPRVPAQHRTYVAQLVERLFVLLTQLGPRPELEAEEGC